MRFPLIAAACLLMTSTAHAAQKPAPDERAQDERLSFQSFDAWSPRTHLDADVAMVYGIDSTLPARIESWRKRGYRIHVMIGVAWGEYQDYLFGQFDGNNHEDESQTDRNDRVIGHGVNVLYMSPGESYGKYLTAGAQRAIDARAEAIHLEEPEFHTALASWVRQGGAVVVPDDDRDPYNAVQEWWNKAPLAFKTPRQHLFQVLGLPADATGMQRVGKGIVLRERISPAALTYEADGADRVRRAVMQAASEVRLPWTESNALVLRRGPYLVASGLDESVPNAPAPVLRGRLVDLFDAQLPVLWEVALSPGKRALLLDLDRFPARRARVVAAACRVRDEAMLGRTLSFRASGIAETNAVVRLVLPGKPQAFLVKGLPLAADRYDFEGGTLRIRFANSPKGVPVEVRW